MEWDENATIPFVFGRTVVIVREVPAEVCGSCGEAYMTGDVTDRVMDSVEKFRDMKTEVSVVPYKASS